MDYVLDASFVAPLCLAENESPASRSFFANLREEDLLLVPALWWFEMSNIIAGAVRRGRLGEADALEALQLLREINPAADERGWAELSVEVYSLARLYALTAYDAAYLELAARRGATLCSHDGALRGAAAKAGVPVVPQMV